MDLVVVERFLNTLDERTFHWHGRKRERSDALNSVEALTAWLEANDLTAPGRPLRASDLTAAVELRTALRAALTGDAQALAAFPLRLAPDQSGRLRLTATSDTPGLAAIIETVATSVADGGWKRLKLCTAEDCRWAYYDTSRNGGGRWCSMEACGNRNKTRAYRRRHAD